MGGGDSGNDRDIRGTIPGGVLDSVRKVENMTKREIMTEEEFESWYDWLKRKIYPEGDMRSRMAYIEGFFDGMKGKAYTSEQVVKILALRYPEEME